GVGIQRLHLELWIDQAAGIGEWRQAEAVAGCQLPAMHAQAQPSGEVTEQAKAVAGLDDEQPGPVDRRDLVEDVVQRGALAGAGGAEEEQVGVHLSVMTVRLNEGVSYATRVEEGDARMARALATSPHRRQIGSM